MKTSKSVRLVEECRELLDLIGAADRLTSEKDREFVASVRTRLDRYGDATYMSEKQLFWLRDIKDRVLDGSAFEPDGGRFEEDLSDS